MSSPPFPVCEFLCGDYGSDTCTNVCNHQANCAVTPAILYAFLNGIGQNINFFYSGVGSLVGNQLSSLLFRVSIYQQIPWLIGFFIFLLIMIMSNLLRPSTGILLFVIVLVVSSLFIYITLVDTAKTVASTSQQGIAQLNIDYANVRNEVSFGTYAPLLSALGNSKVACPG